MSTVAVNRKSIGEVEAGVRSKRRSKSRARARAGAMVINRSIAFLGVAVVSYMATNITGHVMIDQARRDAGDAKHRLNNASRAVAGLERRVRDLRSSGSVELWASANGYLQAEIVPQLDDQEKTLVAQRD